MTGGTFEALHIAMRKSKDGMIVSFRVHQDDISTELNNLPIGARVAIRWAEMTDTPAPGTEQSEGGDVDQTDSATHMEKPRQPVDVDSTARPANHKERKRFSELPLSQQAGMRCRDQSFHVFLNILYPHYMSAEDAVRDICHVDSRSRFDSDSDAALAWMALNARYESWLATQQHAETFR